MTIIKTLKKKHENIMQGKQQDHTRRCCNRDTPLEVTIYPCMVVLGALSSEEGLGVARWSILFIWLPKTTQPEYLAEKENEEKVF